MRATIGAALQLDVFGASHEPVIGMTLCGFPAGVAIEQEKLQAFLTRRAPGRNVWSTGRREPDIPQFQNGLVDGLTTGEPITAVIENRDIRSASYDTDVPRPGHADFAAYEKYGAQGIKTGGGHFSGRMTAPLCVAGGLCLQYLEAHGVNIGAHAASIAGIKDDSFDPVAPNLAVLRGREFPVLNREQGKRMQEAILNARGEQDSVGGIVECAVTGLPAGLGEHPFGTMEGRISALLFAIPALKGVDFGSGFSGSILRGSENNDEYTVQEGKISTRSNHHGGILGGMTTGMPLLFRAAFKPTPSIGLLQQSVSLSTLEKRELRIRGRHDPCIVPRAVPVVEAVAAIVLLDAMLSAEKE